jgi:uncharacterized protein
MITNELYDVTHNGDLKAVSVWLDQRPDDLNADIGDGYTPLHVACIFGHEPLVQHLVARGALVNVNSKNPAATTALHLATGFRDETIAKRLILFLLEHGAELNIKQEGGLTPLHHAVARGSALLADCLVMEGADPFLKDDQSRSPSDLAKSLTGDAAEEQEMIQAALKRAFSLPLETRA